MIKRTFECAKGHITEPYVNASDDLEGMKKAGKLICMDCGGPIETIHLPRTNINSGLSRQSAHQQSALSPEQMKAALKELRRQVEANCDYVGERFAEEAVKIHYGEEPARAIYGETTPDEEIRLKEIGVPFGRLPGFEPENG